MRWPRSCRVVRRRATRWPGRRQTLTLHLPGTARGPVPSPETGAEPPARGCGCRVDRSRRWCRRARPRWPRSAALADPDPGRALAAGGLAALPRRARRPRLRPRPARPDAAPAGHRGRRADRPLAPGDHRRATRPPTATSPPRCRRWSGPTARRAGPHPARRARRPGRRAPRGRCMPERLLLGHRAGPKAPLPDRWIAALTAADPTLPDAPPGRGARAAAAALGDWMRAANEANGPIRVSFRLSEPLARRRRRGGWSSRCSRPRTRASTCRPPSCGTGVPLPGPAAAARRDAAGRPGPGGPALPAAARGAARPASRTTMDARHRARRTSSCARPRRCCRRPASACSCRPGPGARASG